MDEEFKVRFVVDMGDTEKRIKRLKNDFVSIENKEIHFKSNIGDIDKNANSVFRNLRSRMEDVNKNPIWSNAKKQEYLKFFKGMEQTASKAFYSMETKYSRFAQELASWDSQKNALQVELNLKDGQAEEIRHQIDEEMSKPSRVGTYQDLAKMQAEYNKLTNMKLPYEKAAQRAQEQGNTLSYESWIRDLKRIDEYQKKLMDDMQNFKIGESVGGPDYDKIASLREKYDEIQKEAEELDKEITKMGSNPAMEKKRQELEAIRIEYGRLMVDLQGNPLDDQFRSQSLQSLNPQVENLNNGLDRSGMKIKWNTKLTEAWGRMMGRLKSRVMFSITSMLNPIRLIRQAWSSFLDQNIKTKNTLNMISLNLQRIIAPVLQKVANFIFKMAKYANVLTKAWFNVDLFDRSVISGEKVREQMRELNQMTAGFDELNVFQDKNQTLEETELPEVDTSKLENWAKGGFGKKVGDVLNWALEHPFETAGILLGTKLLGGLLFGKGIGILFKKGLSKLFGGSEATKGAVTGGSFLGKIFGKELYAGMNGKAVTVGKLLGGIALTAGGTALAISQAASAGKNWQDLTTGAKLGKTALVGLGSAAAGLGAVMLGASGPIGWAVAGGVALVSFAVGMAQVQDGIDSVKKETERLTEANQNAEVANQNYMISVQNAASTLSALEQAEQATGLSGAALDEQVRNGTLNVENMTSAQLAVYNAYLQNEEAIKRLKEATEAKREADHQAVLQALKVEAANAIESESYDTLREKVVKAWNEGSISAQEAGDILSRTLAHADDETQRTFGQSIPQEMRNAFNPDQYESGWRKFGTSFKNAMEGIGDWFKKKWSGIKNWWNGLWGKNQIPEPDAPSGLNGNNFDPTKNKRIASYAVGTNYVPNDQLAYIHQGEAIIPAKYNNEKTFGNHDAYLKSTLDSMNSEIASLRNLINQGIPVTGEFIQRGSDLYATVEKARSKRGNQPLSNPAYAR